MECCHCNTFITNYTSINDGGTIICSKCGKRFHPEIKLKDKVIVNAHPCHKKGPLNCDICKEGLKQEEEFRILYGIRVLNVSHL